MRRCTKKKSLMLLRTKPSERLPWFTSLISALTSDTPFINAIEHALSLDTRPHRTPPVLTLPSVVVCVRDKEDRCVFVPPSLCTASLQEKNNNNKKKMEKDVHMPHTWRRLKPGSQESAAESVAALATALIKGLMIGFSNEEQLIIIRNRSAPVSAGRITTICSTENILISLHLSAGAVHVQSTHRPTLGVSLSKTHLCDSSFG